MYEKILVPLDGSRLAETALPYAEELAGAFNSEVILIGICEPAESQYLHMCQLYIEKMAELVRSHIKGETRIKVKSVSLVGEPAQEIINYAEENNISLTIMTTHARSGIMLWVMGSITDRVLPRINMSVLLIRAEAPSLKVGGEMFNKILVPLDGSEAGKVALPYVRELSKKLKSEVILLQVVAPGQHVHTVGGLDYVLFADQQVESMKAQAKQYLEKVSRELTGTTIRSEVRVGDASREIIKFTDETNISLVAISTHGHSGIRQWIFGNVTHKILQTSNTPVLLVKAPEVKMD